MVRCFLSSALLLCTILSSCKKDNGSDSPILADSLGVGWSKVDIGADNEFSDIFFIGKKGFGVGQNKIFRSSDGGNTWEFVKETELGLTNIAMWGENNMITNSYYGGSVYYTTNGGDSFDSVSIADQNLSDVFFINETTAFMIGDSFWKTLDGGRNWNKIHDFEKTGNQVYYSSLYFLDDLNGWVTNSKGLFKTVNGGVDWQSSNIDVEKTKVSSIFFLDKNNGYVNATGNAIKTINGGTSWQIILKTEQPLFADVHFFTKDAGFISMNKSIYSTVDGGATLKKEVELSRSDENAEILELHFTDANHGWACGYKGIVLKYVK